MSRKIEEKLDEAHRLVEMIIDYSHKYTKRVFMPDSWKIYEEMKKYALQRNLKCFFEYMPIDTFSECFMGRGNILGYYSGTTSKLYINYMLLDKSNIRFYPIIDCRFFGVYGISFFDADCLDKKERIYFPFVPTDDTVSNPDTYICLCKHIHRWKNLKSSAIVYMFSVMMPIVTYLKEKKPEILSLFEKEKQKYEPYRRHRKEIMVSHLLPPEEYIKVKYHGEEAIFDVGFDLFEDYSDCLFSIHTCGKYECSSGEVILKDGVLALRDEPYRYIKILPNTNRYSSDFIIEKILVEPLRKAAMGIFFFVSEKTSYYRDVVFRIFYDGISILSRW